MRRTLLFICSVALLGCSITVELSPAQAGNLTSAKIQKIIKTVNLIPQGKDARSANLSDMLRFNDALTTGASSRATLKFNDGSVARVGEWALFRFISGTRNFNLNNGTALYIIPPKQGTTKVSTPHASAGIRGSALFVRVDAAKGITVIGALTNNPEGDMDITMNGSQEIVPLKAGQLAVISGGKIELFKFDLKEFYNTSELVKGFNLDNKDTPSDDPDVNKVRDETLEALANQTPVVGSAIAEPPIVGKVSATSLEQATASSDELKPLPDMPPIANGDPNNKRSQLSRPIGPVLIEDLKIDSKTLVRNGPDPTLEDLKIDSKTLVRNGDPVAIKEPPIPNPIPNPIPSPAPSPTPSPIPVTRPNPGVGQAGQPNSGDTNPAGNATTPNSNPAPLTTTTPQILPASQDKVTTVVVTPPNPPTTITPPNPIPSVTPPNPAPSAVTPPSLAPAMTPPNPIPSVVTPPNPTPAAIVPPNPIPSAVTPPSLAPAITPPNPIPSVVTPPNSTPAAIILPNPAPIVIAPPNPLPVPTPALISTPTAPTPATQPAPTLAPALTPSTSQVLETKTPPRSVVTTPPVTTPPVTPPVTTPPVTTPPVTAPITTPPVTAPITTPPVTTPPVTAPITTPPVTTPVN